MKILFVLENFYPHIGGVETLFKKLTEALVEQGHEVSVLTTRKNNTDKLNENMNGVQIHRVPYDNRYKFTFLAGIPAIRLSKDVDIIHTTSYNAAVPAWLASKWNGIPSLITFHEVWAKLWYEMPFMTRMGQLVHYIFEQIILRLSFKKYIGVSDYTASALAANGIKEEKIVRIYNGLNYEEFKVETPPQKGPYDFTFFGRLGMSKGLDLIIEAASLLKEEKPSLQILLILPKEPAGFLVEIKKRIEEKNLNQNIEIVHSLSFDQLKNKIAKAKAVLIPSYSEGFCFAAAETMALGTPIISSGRGALNEVVGGKYLEMKSQSPEALRDCMKLAIENKWEVKSAQKFELKVTVDAYIRLYNKLLTS